MPKVTSQFFEAAKTGKLDVLRNTLDSNPEAHKAFSGGMQALHFAARHNQSAAVALLLSRGADINCQATNGMTAVSWATNGSLDALQTLVNHGANLTLLDQNGNSPLLLALKSDDPARSQMENVLLPAGAHYGLAEAVCNGDVQAVRSAFCRNADALQELKQSPTGLLRSLTFGRSEGETQNHVEIFKILMGHGWNVPNEILLSEAQGCADSNRPLLTAAMRAYVTSNAAQPDIYKVKPSKPKKKGKS